MKTGMLKFFQQLRLAVLVMRVRRFARKANAAFKDLLGILKRGEYVFAERQRAQRGRTEFLEQNRDTQVDQNVARNTDNKRAWVLLILTCFFEGVLSWKGLQYLLDHLVGITDPRFIMPAAAAFAMFAVYGSMIVNHFAKRFREANFIQYVYLSAASYALVFVIPICNMLEAYESFGGPDGSSFTIALNWAIVLITVFFHTSLVTMSNVFITAKNSKVAIKILAAKDNALRKAELGVQALNNSFFSAKGMFSQKAREFVAGFKELQGQNAEAAHRVLYLLDNFTIWMINNKVYQHQVLPYHANEQGQPVVETSYFDPRLDALVTGWDQLSSVTVYRGNRQDDELPDTDHPTMELPDNERHPDNNQHADENTDGVGLRPDNMGNDGEVSPPNDDPPADPTDPNPHDKIL